MMNAMTQGQVITVKHLCKDGWHTFTCAEVPGFHLVSTEADLEVAYAQVPEAIAEIIQSDTGVPTDVELENSYSEYLAKIPDTMRPPVRYYSVKSAA
jgi:hypothetical protein